MLPLPAPLQTRSTPPWVPGSASLYAQVPALHPTMTREAALPEGMVAAPSSPQLATGMQVAPHAFWPSGLRQISPMQR